MNSLDISLAPGCYGMSMCYKEGSTECDTCPFASSCKPACEQQLATLRAEFGIVAPEVKSQRPVQKVTQSVPADTMTLTNGLPKKIAAWISYIEREGIKVVETLTKGENPFAGRRPTFLNIACLLLLKKPEGVSRDLLRQCFMQKLSWSDETAASHITQTRQILSALGAIDEVDGMIRLRAA